MRVLIFLLSVIAVCALKPSLVHDGSFEDIGNNNSSNVWNVTFKPGYNGIVCSMDTCENAENIAPGPVSGIWFLWFGGFGYAEASGDVNQTIYTRTTSMLEINFYLKITTFGKNKSWFYVIWNDKIFTFNGNDDYPAYKVIKLYVKPSLDGRNDFRLKYHCEEDSAFHVSHFFVDDVTIRSINQQQ
jgi:hypothetical protein